MINQPTTDFSTLPPIIAVDFDGTLVYDEFPNIGKKRGKICDVVKQLQMLGVKSILWTSRTGTYLDEAVKWCEEHGLRFDAINQNIPEVIELTGGEDTRKVYADRYIDDRSCAAHDHSGFWDSLQEVVSWLGR